MFLAAVLPMALLRILAIAAAFLALGEANAQTIAGAIYDPVREQLVVDIIYQGTNPNHQFDLVWGQCDGESPHEVEARLIDRQGDDVADKEFRVRRRFDLKGLKCRPALLTLRLSRHLLSPVFIPAAPR